MAETLVKYPNTEALAKDFALEQDASGFYRTPEGVYIGYHRTRCNQAKNLSPAEAGTMGPGVYIGNSEAVVASFSRVSFMNELVVVELECQDNHIYSITNPYTFDRRRFDTHQNKDQHIKLLTWRPPVGNTIGCIAMNGISGIPRKPRWGLWIDASTPLKPFAQISR